MKKKDIEFLDVVALRGPNIWTYRPVLEAWVDIGALEECPSNVIPGFYERLTAWLPSLIEHRCSPGVRGGFLQRLREGTWPACQAGLAKRARHPRWACTKSWSVPGMRK
ncbi:cyanophycin synthetase [Bordetella holmesii]|nr:cyanophycin synthetase [Bordetella holmesii]